MSAAEHRRTLRALVDGYRASTLVHLAARLGLADRLAAGAQTAEELALAAGVLPDPLERVLRGLAVVGVVRSEAAGRYALTDLGAELRSGAEGALAELARVAGEEYLPAWGALFHTVSTGDPSFNTVFGVDPWEHRRQHPALRAAFDTWLRDQTSTVANGIVAAYPFPEAGLVVDVGGGQGALLAAVLDARPSLHGVLFDLPAACADAQAFLDARSLADRCRAQGGDFFTEVPAGADLYLLKSVLHDWDDARSGEILAACRRAMRASSRLLVIERVLPARPEEDPTAIFWDLHMMVVLGGRERSLAHYETLARAANLAVSAISATAAGFQIVELRR